MPRVSRYVVEFTPLKGGPVWEAKFEHQHRSSKLENGVEKVIIPTIDSKDRLGRPIKVPVLHITTCLLKQKGQPANVRGVASCSLKDEYNSARGLKTAFQRALVKLGLAEERSEKRLVSKRGEKTLEVVHLFEDAHPKNGPYVGSYGEFMSAFFREVGVREQEPPTGSSAVLVGEVLPAEHHPVLHTHPGYPAITEEIIPSVVPTRGRVIPITDHPHFHEMPRYIMASIPSMALPSSFAGDHGMGAVCE